MCFPPAAGLCNRAWDATDFVVHCRIMPTATAALLLLLPRAATACPSGWTPSPDSGTCFKVPPERSTSLFRCVELCEEHGGAPACIGSAEDNRHVTAELAATEGLWLGLYQNETGLGPAKGWGRCVAGDAPSFTNWRMGRPDDYHGYQQHCAWVEGVSRSISSPTRTITKRRHGGG